MKACVKMSSISDYFYCQRSVYLSEVLGLKKELSVDGAGDFLLHILGKKLSLRQHRVLERIDSPEDIEGGVRDELQDVLDDAERLCEGLFGDASINELIAAAMPGLLKQTGAMENKLVYMVEEIGLSETLERIRPWKTDFFVESEDLSLTGKIDKVMKDKGCYPVEIRTRVPGGGVWDEDKLQVCAYSMVLEDVLDVGEVPYGFVECLETQARMPVMNMKELRERVIETRDDILAILREDIPEICPHGNGRKCESCGFYEKCYEI
ncbi:MAG: Dna2/Cas4 domain-containing protein [Candidatus Altiarchaeota archaeon]|nr:Dna2/Cas4 domain-containing protein [Candidatus Altiarchaeota archaeon]